MKCFICNGEMKPYFSKKMGLSKRGMHEYMRCEKCGIVIDRTAYEQDIDQIKEDIIIAHTSYQKSDINPDTDLNWIERLNRQAKLLVQFYSEGIFQTNIRVVDYGCGDGKLSEYFQQKCRVLLDHKAANECSPKILKYDKYMKPDNDNSYLSDCEMQQGMFDVVITCSLLEHLIGKKDIDEVFCLLNDRGTFCLHTLICEEVPRDPDWFYLLEGHVTLWTNAAMKYIYKQYKFVGCAYNLETRMWFFFRDRKLFHKLIEKEKMLDGVWETSTDFIDYWKCSPYRK